MNSNLESKLKPNHLIAVFFLLFCLLDLTFSQLSSKIFNIQKSFEEVPIINLAHLSTQIEPMTLLFDTGSSELAIFDNQCDDCEHTFSVCPHIKNTSNQTFISYLMTQFKGDYSYLTLGNSIRLRFFCVLQIQGNDNGLQTNGVLGIQISKMNLIDKTFKETNGIKVWRRIIEKIFENEIKLIKEDVGSNTLPKLRLKYSIYYSPYHTKLIFGQIPEIYSKNSLGQLSLTQQSFTNSLTYFPQKNQSDVQTQKIQQTIVHFDSGSSVIVLPWSIFDNLFRQINDNLEDNPCKIQNSQIKCLKNSLKTLILSNSNFQIFIYQKNDTEKSNQLKFSIGLQNLISKSHVKEDNSWFTLKFIGHNKTNEEEKDFIILGVPLFKQYLIQFDIPMDLDHKGPIQNIVHGLKQRDDYIINFYDLQSKENGELMSPYEHLIKKYEKNIKLFTFFYLFFVFLFTFCFIKLYWLVDQFIKGKRQLV